MKLKIELHVSYDNLLSFLFGALGRVGSPTPIVIPVVLYIYKIQWKGRELIMKKMANPQSSVTPRLPKD